MIKKISSKTNARVKYAVSLKDRKNQEVNHQFLGESKKALELALQNNLVSEVFTLEKLDLPDEIIQYLVSQEIIEKISNLKNPEGVIFIANYPKYKKDNLNKILYLDEINDPGNLGTMVRTALAFNFDAVVLSKHCVSIYNSKALMSAKGSNYSIPVFEEKLDNIAEGKKIIVSTLSSDSISATSLPKLDKFVLVMGNEAHGVSEDALSRADIKVKIDIQNIDSLNVSVAAAILMYELTE